MYAPTTWRQRTQRQGKTFCCEKCGEQRLCRGDCGRMKYEKEFSPQEWRRAGFTSSRGRLQGRCLDCAGRNCQLKLCNGICAQRLPEVAFSFKMWNKRGAAFIKCKACCKARTRKSEEDNYVDEKWCNECRQYKSQSFFSDQQWYHVGKNQRKCTGCCKGPQSPGKLRIWTCRAPGCTFTGDIEFFRHWRSKQKVDKAKGWEKCNTCFLALDPDVQNLAIRRRDLQHTTIPQSSSRKSTP